MASKAGSSSGIGAKDVAYQLQAFELVNKCELRVTLSVVVDGGTPNLFMDVTAYPSGKEIGEAPPLGFSRFNLGAQGFLSMEAAILFGLYQIDFVLADGEFSRTIK